MELVFQRQAVKEVQDRSLSGNGFMKYLVPAMSDLLINKSHEKGSGLFLGTVIKPVLKKVLLREGYDKK
eukprot:7537031-Ditylum_brightwellii.AAC.1